MFIALKTKIWLTILTIVLLFASFTLIYFPAKQGQYLLKTYDDEVQNYANTVALGVRIALKEQNYEGVQTAMQYVKETSGFKFVSLLQLDTIWNLRHDSFEISETIFSTFPETMHPLLSQASSDSIIIKRALFESQMMNGAIMVGFSTQAIKNSQQKIRKTSLMVTGSIFLVGMLIGLWFARNISVPVRALRDAALRVGEGDLDVVIEKIPNDEIGDLSKAFNNMVLYLSKAREDLRESNQTLSETNQLLNITLTDLKSTQSQLIQSEKMASLGELTAGIAHEIQNPLNFVNNFSDINTELIGELNEAAEKGDMHEVKLLAKDIKENEEKIMHHGKRADAIVKGMLQHSRSNTGEKEPTNINTLTEEYLRLAYHGMRAKDKSFNVTLHTDYDSTIGLIKVIPQDMGRVLLNLITNAFHAVSSAANQPKADLEYIPSVTVTTKLLKSPTGQLGAKDSAEPWTEIRISDNGSGIPPHIVDKIFQPFFTTKPTGQGTGLGLSLSYDIVKAHDGNITVETKEGEGTTFIIHLPIRPV